MRFLWSPVLILLYFWTTELATEFLVSSEQVHSSSSPWTLTSAKFKLNNSESGRIINGKPIDITQVPFQVKIIVVFRDPKEWALCGGSIIRKNFVITAAHCVTGVRFVTNTSNLVQFECFKRHYVFSPQFIWVVAGSSMNTEDYLKPDGTFQYKNIIGDGVRLKVKTVIPHCGYVNIKVSTPDIALLELEKDITQGPKIDMIPIRTTLPKWRDDQIPFDNIKGPHKITGWGGKTAYEYGDEEDVDYVQSTSKVLLEAPIELLSKTQCKQAFLSYVHSKNDPNIQRRVRNNANDLDNNTICGEVSKGDTCQGDSGNLQPIVTYRIWPRMSPGPLHEHFIVYWATV